MLRFISFLTLLYLLSGCSEAPEGGLPFMIELNQTSIVEEEDPDPETPEEKTEVLTLSSMSSITLEEGSSSSISFLLQSYNSDTSLLSSVSSGSISITSPSCITSSETTKICSATVTANSSGSGIASIYVSDKSDIKISISVSVPEPEESDPEVPEDKTEVLTLSSLSSLTLEVNESANISFLLQNYNSDTSLLTSITSSFISIADPNCIVSSSTTKICSSKIGANSSGNGVASIYVSDKSDIKISISVTVSEPEVIVPDENISDDNSSSIDNNISEDNSSKVDENLTEGELEFMFAEGQESSLTLNSGESFIITTVVNYPRDDNETLEVSTSGNEVSSIVETYLDETISDETKSVFRTEVNALNYGEDSITFKLVDTNLSLLFSLKVLSDECYFDEDEFISIESGEVRDEIMVGTKLGFNSVKLIYPRLQYYSSLENQNFIYILDNEAGGTSHSSVEVGSFAFMKFSEDLVGEDYHIHYKKDGTINLVCLNGIFPERDLIEVDSETVVEEEPPPSSPTN